MATSALCMNCMHCLPEGASACPTCGAAVDEQNLPQYLPVGTLLSDRYLVGRVQRTDGDAAVYIGYDQVQKAPVGIREFFPDTLCERQADGDLRPIMGCETLFEEYKEKFRQHARTVARMRDLPASIPIYDIFPQNETVYAVSEWCEGKTLDAWLAERGGRLSWDEARPLFIPLTASLISLHEAGVLHLALCPENLILTADGKLHIDGFAIAEARTVSGDLQPHIPAGFAAPEQYRQDAVCGCAADVYGLAATIFRTIVGTTPPDGASRTAGGGDLLVPADAAKDLPAHVAAALFNALQPDAAERTPTIAALRDRLSAAPAVTALQDDARAEEAAATETKDEPVEDDKKATGHRAGYALVLIIVVVLMLLGVMTFVLYLLVPNLFGGGSKPSSDPLTATTTTLPSLPEATTTVAGSEDMLYPVPDVVGKNYYDERGNHFGNRTLELAGLKYSDLVPKGQIISQEPKAESQAPITENIKVIISAGPEKITVPDVSGLDEAQARQFLELAGFRVEQESTKLPLSSYERGKVDSTSPAAGNRLTVGSKITLRISDQQPATTPPVTTPDATTPNTDVTTPPVPDDGTDTPAIP